MGVRAKSGVVGLVRMHRVGFIGRENGGPAQREQRSASQLEVGVNGSHRSKPCKLLGLLPGT